MGSRDDNHTLPPLIDFGEEDNASPSTGAQPFNYTSSSPLRDPFSAFELSPTGSSSSPFHSEQWEVTHSAAGSSSTPFFFDQTPITFNGVDFPASSQSTSGNCPSSKSYTYKHNGSPYEGKDLLSDFSAASVSCPQIDLLSSPDVSSHRISESKSSPGLSSLSQQSLPRDTLLQQALDSMSFHTPPMCKNPSSKNMGSSNDFRASLNQASSESPFSVSLSTKDSSPYMSQGANDSEGFWSDPFPQPVKEKMTEVTQLRSSQNGLKFHGKAMDVLEDADFGRFFDVAKPTTGGFESFHSGKKPAVGESDTWPFEGHSGSFHYSAFLDDKQGSQTQNVNNMQKFQDAGKDNQPLHQKTAKLQESHGTTVGRMKEFVSAGGRRGGFKAPDRGEDGPVAFELRPQPLQEMPVQPTRVLACTDTALWLGCDQGIMVWDIPGAFKSSCDGKSNMKGDEDAAAYSRSVHELAPLCLVADTTNHLMWSGHKDGRVRAWHLTFEHASENASDGNTAVFTWQAHQTAVLAMIVTSYGELWTGSDSGSLRVWPQNVIAQAFSSSKESMHVATSLVATSYIELRTRGMSAGASSLATIDVRFLIAEHSQCRVWSGGSHLLALWDARTKDVLKVFGPNADAEFPSPNVSPIREIGKGEEIKPNVTKALKKEKNLGTLSFFQRSRNAVIGAADAVLRAAVGVQSIDDSKKMEALVSAADGNVWAGYANGRLGQWDSSGNWLADYRHSSTAVRCMYAFGNQIFVGYADGVVHALAMSSGKLLRAWRAHKSSVAKLGVCGNHLFTLADNGGVRGWFITSRSTFDKALHQRMISKQGSYLRQENLKILAGTWNVGQEKASFKSMLSWLEKGCIEASIIAVGLQEVEMGAGALAMAAAKETVGLAGSVNGQWWLDNIEDVLIKKKPFVRVGSRQLAGLLIGVWVTKEFLPYVGGVDVGAVACGFGRAFGNKGAVAVKVMVFRRTVCVVNCHFAAHMDGVAKRNADFDHIYQRMAFGRSFGGVGLAATTMAASAVQIIRGNNNRQDTQSLEQTDIYLEKDNESDAGATMPELSEADLLIWVGDFNYRLADLSYTEAVGLVYAKNWEELIKKDQLRSEMKAGKVFQGMREAYITFQPTYKFDKGSTELGYDTSDKRRIPAWCDRVLYRDSFDSCEVEAAERKLGLSRPIAASASWYEACMATVESDHKPVSCLLDVQVAVINEAARRWEYGRFLRTDPEALTMQNQINIVPETVVHMNNVVLVNRTKATLEISNESAEETALFSIHCEGEPIGSLSQNQLFERKHGTCGLPFWLQVLPASGVIHPRQTVEVVIQYAGRDISIEDESSSKGISDLEHRKIVILVVKVTGLISSSSKQHQVRVSHSFSTASGDQRGSYSQRGINYR